MTKLSLDYETASKVDLRKHGADVYSRDPRTKALMLAWRFDAEPVRLWLPHKQKMPTVLRDGIESTEVVKTAWNAAFELAITRNTLGIDTDVRSWRCVMVMALSLGLPGKLEVCARDALRLPKEFHKDPEGDRLMRLFSYPSSKATWETHPEEFSAYGRYCMQDVTAECKAYDILIKYVPNIESLFRRWAIDREINDRGLPVDVDFINTALNMAEASKARYREKLKEMTGLDNPNSTPQMGKWLKDRGYPFASLAKNRVQIALVDHADAITQEAKDAIKVRLESNKTSLAKYNALLRSQFGGRLRDTLQYMGAGATGRWAGRILGQNMPRPWKGVEEYLREAREMIAEGDLEGVEQFFGKPLEVLASSIRSAISPPPGRKLVVADLSSIELVVIAWLTRCKFWLDVLDQGKDAYKAFAVEWLQIEYDTVTKAQRTLSKPPALGCGYRMGAGRAVGTYPDIEKTGLWGYAANMQVQMTQKECRAAVKIYRKLSPEIKNAWADLEESAMECVRSGEPQRSTGGIVFDLKKPFLRMRLPSGRYIHYCRPRIEKVQIEFEDEETGEVKKSWTTNITYERLSQTSKKWVRRANHGGRFIEQAVQGIARDILEIGILNAEKEGLNVVAHYHDEILCEVDSGEKGALARLIACMTKTPKWAGDMTLRAAGYESNFYKKD